MINAKDIWHCFRKLKIILLQLHNMMEYQVNLIAEQLENMLALWPLKNITRAETMVKETSVFVQRLPMEQIQQLQVFVE